MKIINTKEVNGIFIPVGEPVDEPVKQVKKAPQPKHVPRGKPRKTNGSARLAKEYQEDPLNDFIQGIRVVMKNFGGF